jgi:hypothetical protein
VFDHPANGPRDRKREEDRNDGNADSSSRKDHPHAKP